MKGLRTPGPRRASLSLHCLRLHLFIAPKCPLAHHHHPIVLQASLSHHLNHCPHPTGPPEPLLTPLLVRPLPWPALLLPSFLNLLVLKSRCPTGWAFVKAGPAATCILLSHCLALPSHFPSSGKPLTAPRQDSAFPLCSSALSSYTSRRERNVTGGFSVPGPVLGRSMHHLLIMAL